METGIFFDKESFSNELQSYQNAAKALSSIKDAFKELEIGEIDFNLVDRIKSDDWSKVKDEYINKQVSTAGKNPILKEAVLRLAAERFDVFRMTIEAIPEKQIGALRNVDYTLISIDGAIDEARLKARHTYEPKTERQRDFIERVNRILNEVNELREFLPEGFHLVGDNQCFWVDYDGSLKYSIGAIQLVE
jgi:hypothetical protein